jgi:transcriptional regulator with XRE-family HTH domain/Zn-dependent peptidase ImmA (M78 family)
MISNERQYRITKAAAEKFKQLVDELDTRAPAPKGMHPRLVNAQREAAQSQLDELLEEIAEYERLKTGNVPVIQLDSLDELPDGLIKARIASGLSQKDLAERLNLKEQQIQRYEADRYASASLQRIVEIAHAIGISVRKELLMPLAPSDFKALVTKLRQAGLDTDFLTSKLLPTTEIARLDGTAGPVDDARLIAQTAEVVNRVFGWSEQELFAPAPLSAPRYAAAEARFKIPAGRRTRATNLYAAYANYLAVIILKASEGLPRIQIPTNPDAFRSALLKQYGQINLINVLHFAWDLGVPVLPLRDRGTFHAACWRYGFRNVVVLKQNSPYLSRWLFDLLHELFHASQHREEESLEVIEADATSPERANSDEEVAASQFAGDIILEGRAEKIAQASVSRAQGSVERLKGVVPDIAKEFGVDAGSVANYLAFRLSWQGINWWGAAANLQRKDENPWDVARDVFLKRFSFNLPSNLDRQLLQRALQ